MELKIAQKLSQTLSPQMIQFMEVLQMGTQELREYLETAVQDNPVLELQEHYERRDESADMLSRWEWLDSHAPRERAERVQDAEDEPEPLHNFASAPAEEETLYIHLLRQLEALELPPDVSVCARFLAGCLDRNGWLEEDLSELARELDRPLPLMERALAAVQALEPAGVGARNLSECLYLQLLRRRPVDKLAVRIVREHLNSLAKCHYGLIARLLGEDQDRVRRACDLIRTLEPRPGAGFSPGDGPVYVVPDVIVSSANGSLEVTLNDRLVPSLNISAYYSRMLREDGDEQVREYLAGKMRQAKWLVQAVEQRRSTLAACADCIVKLQADFFRRGGHLRPMSLADVAAAVGVHESTVSRALNGKYLQCPRGSYPMSHFFSRRLGTEESDLSSADAAKALLKVLIAQEDRARPLSDQKLCERMAEQGCTLSRRTVAKYRDELGIPGAAGRKEYS